MSDHHSHQRFGEPSYGHLQSAAIATSNALDPSRLQPSKELFPMGLQLPVSNVQDEHTTSFLNLPPQVNPDVTCNVNSETSSLHLPHQVFGNANLKKIWGTIPGKISEIHQKDSLPASPFADSSPLPRLMNKSTQKSSLAPEPVLSADFHAPLSPDHTSEVPWRTEESAKVWVSEGTADSVHQNNSHGVSDPITSAGTGANEISKPDRASVLKVEPDSSLDERQQSKQSENEGPNADHTRFESHDGSGISLHKARGKKFGTSAEVVDSQQVASLSPAINSGDDVGATEVKGESKLVESAVSVHSLQMQSSQRAWKPAPGLKPKSFLEIQQEEQRKIQVGMAVSEISTSVHHTSSPTPWAGVVPISDPKISREIQRELNNTEINVGKAETLPSSRSKKSKLHDLLAEVVLAKLKTLLSRKKSAKAKEAGAKAAVPVPSTEMAVSSSPIEKGKGSRTVQQEKEVLPAIPSGPSLGDSVFLDGGVRKPFFFSSMVC
ncbi:hypothetical protein D5086_027073 [Populus alba]|uniref:Uncharacterized protein n=2 Tax=Populus alba TaxID=43335 RepID=A0A4U5QQ02_POPAL|nr:hypothetical protein D5086_0000062600 [Populus alba]